MCSSPPCSPRSSRPALARQRPPPEAGRLPSSSCRRSTRGVRRSWGCGAARSRRRLDRFARTSARIARQRQGRLVARRSRRGAQSCGSPTLRPRRRSTSRCLRPARVTTSSGIRSRSWARATADCSHPGRRASTVSSHLRTSHRRLPRSQPGRSPRIRARADPQAAATLARLDIDLSRAHDARTGATLVLVAWLVAFSSLGVLGGSALAGRAAVLVAPVGSRHRDPAPSGRDRRSHGGRSRPGARRRSRVVPSRAPTRGARSRGRRLSLPVPPDPGRLARRQRARRDRAAPRRRRAVLRGHEPGQHVAPRALARRSGARGSRGRCRDRASSPRHRGVEPRRGGRRRRARRRSGVRGSPGRDDPDSPHTRPCRPRRSRRRCARARDRRSRRAPRWLEPRHRCRRRWPGNAVRRPRPPTPDLVGRSHVGHPHGVPVPPLACRPRRGSAGEGGEAR